MQNTDVVPHKYNIHGADITELSSDSVCITISVDEGLKDVIYVSLARIHEAYSSGGDEAVREFISEEMCRINDELTSFIMKNKLHPPISVTEVPLGEFTR
jgi:hypothetical protein